MNDKSAMVIFEDFITYNSKLLVAVNQKHSVSSCINIYPLLSVQIVNMSRLGFIVHPCY